MIQLYFENTYIWDFFVQLLKSADGFDISRADVAKIHFNIYLNFLS